MSNGKPKPAKEQGKSVSGQTAPRSHLRQFAKSNKDRVLGGVCGGLGQHTDVPGWVWRIVFLLGIPLLLVGPLVYLVLWIALPADKTFTEPAVPPLLRKIDWISFAVTTLLVFLADFLPRP